MKQNDLPIIFRHRILWHVVFWIVIYLAYVISYGGYADTFASEFITNAVLLPVRMLFTYLLLYMLLPMLMKKQYEKFFIFMAIHAFLYGLTLWVVFREYLYLTGDTEIHNYPIFKFPKIFVQIISNIGVPFLAGMLKVFKWWYIDQQYKVQMENEKLESELKFLKAQINPHFLFNTLNNLYALTLQNSQKASDVVIKLSGLLDYMLYHAKEKSVTLDKELTIIENYIELEKIRYGERLDLIYDIKGDTKNIQVAPLILIPFVENAFKHGASNDRTNPVIKIFVEVLESCVQLKVSNSIPKHSQVNPENGNGIGLKNIQRQLQLMYPKAHELDIDITEGIYTVELKLNC